MFPHRCSAIVKLRNNLRLLKMIRNSETSEASTKQLLLLIQLHEISSIQEIDKRIKANCTEKTVKICFMKESFVKIQST